MKKIITVLTAILLLCAMVFSMTSCFGIDMDDLKKDLEGFRDRGEINLTIQEGEAQTGSKAELKKYTITTTAKDESLREALIVIEYANKELAKLYAETWELAYDVEEDGREISQAINEELVNIGESTDGLSKVYEKIVKRKGTVLIYGSEWLYDKIF